jgi:hypothetical protein
LISASPRHPVSASSFLVAVEGIEPTSLDYQSSALAVELHRGRKDLVFGLWSLVFDLFMKTSILNKANTKTKNQSPKTVFRIGGDEGSRTLIVRFTRPTLSYPVELHRRKEGTLVFGLWSLVFDL